MTRDAQLGFLSAVNCLRIESEQWLKLARTMTGPERNVALTVAEAMTDTIKRMVASLEKSLTEAAQEATS